MRLDTDIGPVIDEDARKMLQAHVERMTREAKLLRALPLGPEHANGTFFAPHAFEIGAISELQREVFGPILHVVRYSAARLDKVCEAINATGYGLTLGIHSRIDQTAKFIRAPRPCRQHLCQPQPDRRRGRRRSPLAVRACRAPGPKAGGPALSASLCPRTHLYRQYDRGRWQRRVAERGAGRRSSGRSGGLRGGLHERRTRSHHRIRK